MTEAQGHAHGDEGIAKVDIRVEGCSSQGSAWRISSIAGEILERFANDVRSFDLARGEEGQSHLDVYFNDRLVLSTKGRAGQSDSLDAKEIEGLISEWKAKAAKSGEIIRRRYRGILTGAVADFKAS